MLETAAASEKVECCGVRFWQLGVQFAVIISFGAVERGFGCRKWYYSFWNFMAEVGGLCEIVYCSQGYCKFSEQRSPDGCGRSGSSRGRQIFIHE
jgi:hypothetical protein